MTPKITPSSVRNVLNLCARSDASAIFTPSRNLISAPAILCRIFMPWTESRNDPLTALVANIESALNRNGGRIKTRDVIRVDLLHPSPNVGGQLFGAPLPIPLTIAETSGERSELVRVFFGKSQIARVAANYPERVDQIPQKEVSRAQHLALGL